MNKICAYYDSQLGKCYDLGLHSLRVASFIADHFNDRLQTHNILIDSTIKTTCNHHCNPLQLAIISGLLHDLGKASSFYQSRPNRGFSLHEHVSALVLLAAADISIKKGDEEAEKLLRLIASIIARHHVAIPRRHPDELYRLMRGGKSRQFERYNPAQVMYIINKAVRGLYPGVLSQIGLYEFLPRPLSEYISSAILKLNNINNKIILKLLARTTTPNIIQLNNRIGYKILKLVQIITGALIVSDILVAWKERGATDPGRVYARSWLNELKAETTLDKLVSKIKTNEYEDLKEYVSI